MCITVFAFIQLLSCCGLDMLVILTYHRFGKKISYEASKAVSNELYRSMSYSQEISFSSTSSKPREHKNFDSCKELAE